MQRAPGVRRPACLPGVPASAGLAVEVPAASVEGSASRTNRRRGFSRGTKMLPLGGAPRAAAVACQTAARGASRRGGGGDCQEVCWRLAHVGGAHAAPGPHAHARARGDGARGDKGRGARGAARQQACRALCQSNLVLRSGRHLQASGQQLGCNQLVNVIQRVLKRRPLLQRRAALQPAPAPAAADACSSPLVALAARHRGWLPRRGLPPAGQASLRHPWAPLQTAPRE